MNYILSIGNFNLTIFTNKYFKVSIPWWGSSFYILKQLKLWTYRFDPHRTFETPLVCLEIHPYSKIFCFEDFSLLISLSSHGSFYLGNTVFKSFFGITLKILRFQRFRYESMTALDSRLFGIEKCIITNYFELI